MESITSTKKIYSALYNLFLCVNILNLQQLGL